MSYPRALQDVDAEETREWLDALDAIIQREGPARASFLLERLSSRLSQAGARLPYTITTPYRNTIPSTQEARIPGDLFMDRRIRSLVRWNALATVMRANQPAPHSVQVLAYQVGIPGIWSSDCTRYGTSFSTFSVEQPDTATAPTPVTPRTVRKRRRSMPSGCESSDIEAPDEPSAMSRQPSAVRR